MKNHEIYSSKEILEIKLNVQERIVFLLDELISLKNQSSELIFIYNNGTKDEHLYIGIHRKNCNTYKAQVSDCKEQIYNFESVKKRCEEFCHSIRTDYSIPNLSTKTVHLTLPLQWKGQQLSFLYHEIAPNGAHP